MAMVGSVLIFELLMIGLIAAAGVLTWAIVDGIRLAYREAEAKASRH